jgi:radical SAM protein with 4Fe4S-binding SPASM domain
MPLEEFFQRIGYVTLKLTNGCNLHCSYCNVEALTPQTPKMSMDRFKQVARLLLQNSRQQSVGLEFHGGEPLLLPDEWFEEAAAYARALARQYHKQLEIPLVTNGTLLTEERLLRLNRLGIRFCLSVDGPPEINDRVRGSGHAVERAINLFREHRLNHGVLTVLSRGNYQHMGEVMDWFEAIGIRDFRLNFLQPQGRGNDEAELLTGDEMFEGVRQVFDHMDRTEVAVRENETLLMVDRFLEGRDPRPHLSCWEFECQAGRIYVAVDHNGVIHACGTDLTNHPLGHVDQVLDLDHYHATLNRLHDKGDWVIRCFGCDAKRICRHSCSTSDYNSKDYREHECRFTKLFYRHLCQHPQRAQSVYAIDRARWRRPGPLVQISELRVAAKS